MHEVVSIGKSFGKRESPIRVGLVRSSVVHEGCIVPTLCSQSEVGG